MSRIQIMQSRGGVKGAKRAMDDAIRRALEDTIRHWHQTYMPGHFTEAGFKKYDYQARSGQFEPPYVPKAIRSKGNTAVTRTVKNPKYFWRKYREVQTKRPLVYSGTSMSAAKASIKLSTRKSASEELIQGKGVLDLLSTYFYQYRKDLNQMDKSDELTRVTADEQVDLHRLFEQSFGSYLNGFGMPATTVTL